eukprot:g2972.t1
MLTNFSCHTQGEGYTCSKHRSKKCPAGYYCDGNTNGNKKNLYDCVLCQKGRYENEKHFQKSECKSCVAGQYSSTLGQISCANCEKGKYVDTNLADACKSCTPGRFSDSVGGSTYSSCLACGAGYYEDSYGSTSCKSCAPGRFSDSVGASTYSSCLACGAGYYEDSHGSTSCKACSSGKFSSWGTTAMGCSTECPSGTILNYGKCEVCPSGTSADINRKKCNLCSAGKASDQPYVYCANNGGKCACNGIVRRYHYQRNGFEKDAKTGYKYLRVVGSIMCSNEAFGESEVKSGGIDLSCSCAPYSTSCSDCTPGKYSDAPMASCKECVPGFYNVEKGLQICSACDTGKVQPNPGQSACNVCGNGTVASKIELPCVKCKGGTYTDAPMQLLCKPCEAGFYSNFNEGSTTCLRCPSSRKSPGKTSFNVNATEQCFDTCPQGSIQLAQLNQCQTCTSGKYHLKGASTCTDCIPGMYNKDDGTDYRLHISCKTCDGGKYIEIAGARECKLCLSGKFLSNSNATLDHDNERDCKNCTVGKSTERKRGQSKCIDCATGMYARHGSPTCSGPSGLAEVDYLHTATNIQLTLTKFDGGKYHFLAVSGCFLSRFSENRSCSIVKTPYPTAGEDDLLQPSGFHIQWSQDINFETVLGSKAHSLNSSHHFSFPINVSTFDLTKIVLHVRIASYNAQRGMDVRSKWAIAGSWETAGKCEHVRQFLDIDGIFFNEIDVTAKKIRNNMPTSWRCRRCPTGSSCEGDITWAQVRAKFGYWRMVKSVENNKKFVSFLECPIHEACLGAKNDDEAFSINHKMYAAHLVPLDTYERCNEFLGYEHNERLCGVCQNNYSVKDHFRCKQCSSMHLTVVGATFSVVAFIALMTFITRTTIKDVDDPKSEAEVMKRIILNYFQVLSLASTFPFKWGDDVVSLFSTMGVVSTLGESFVSIDCLMRQYDKETIFYARQAIYFALPGVVGSLFLIFWVSYSYIVGAKWREKRSSRTETTAKDRFLVSFNGFLFLLYPHSCKVVFSSFSCKQIGQDGDFYLPYDLSVKCYEGRHLEFLLIYCVPACLCYVVGLPLLVFFILKKNRAKLDDRAVKLRWGLFFRGFRRKRFYWEVVVAIRKLMIVLIGVLQISIPLKYLKRTPLLKSMSVKRDFCGLVSAMTFLFTRSMSSQKIFCGLCSRQLFYVINNNEWLHKTRTIMTTTNSKSIPTPRQDTHLTQRLSKILRVSIDRLPHANKSALFNCNKRFLNGEFNFSNHTKPFTTTADNNTSLQASDLFAYLDDDPHRSFRIKTFIRREYKKLENNLQDTSSFRRVVLEEMNSRVPENVNTVPEKVGKYMYYEKFENYYDNFPNYCRRIENGNNVDDEKIVLNVNQIGNEKHDKKFVNGHEEEVDYVHIDAMKMTIDHAYLAFTLATTADENFNLCVRDIRNEKTYFDLIKGITSCEWSDSKSTVSDKNDNNYYAIYYTKANHLGRPYQVNSKTTSEVSVVSTDYSDDTVRCISKRKNGKEYYIDHVDHCFYIVHTINDKYKISTLDDNDDFCMKNWKDIDVDVDDDTEIEDIDVFKEYCAIFERKRGKPQIRVFQNSNPENIKNVKLPELVGNVLPGINQDYDGTSLRMTMDSPLVPELVFDYNIVNDKTQILRNASVCGSPTFNRDDYVIYQTYVKSEEGEENIPMTIVHSKSITRNANNPVLLHGYGAYGVNLDVGFQANTLSILSRGWIVAYAHVRGGSELGKKWYLKGRGMNKKNTFRDYASCAKYLIDNNWTNPDMLCGHGMSAGGLLLGAVANMYPGLFKAMILKVPFTDPYTSMCNPSLPLTIHEYDEWGGNPLVDKDVHDYILSYSPYQNIKEQIYPSMLVTGSTLDNRVPVAQPMKFIEKVRQYNVNNDALLLLSIQNEYGHFGLGGRYGPLQEAALEYAFLTKVLGLEY